MKLINWRAYERNYRSTGYDLKMFSQESMEIYNFDANFGKDSKISQRLPIVREALAQIFENVRTYSFGVRYSKPQTGNGLSNMDQFMKTFKNVGDNHLK